MIEPQIPELADGGYWYTEPVSSQVVNGEEPYVATENLRMAKAITFFVEVEGNFFAVHRTLTQVADLQAVSQHNQIISALGAKKPYARVNGA